MKKIAAMLVVLMSLMIFVSAVRFGGSGTVGAIRYKVDTLKTQLIANAEEGIEGDPIPFNVDMVDAETTSNDGQGIYVAVLDTGLLSNYLYFFPPSMVDIKEEWGKGFTHDALGVDPNGDLILGPLRDDRGFITHDNGAPDANGYGWGSGHGTHVTSIITGYHFVRGGVDTWIAGVAPKVTIIPVLVLDDWTIVDQYGNLIYFDAFGTDEMVAAGIRYIGDLANEHHVKIIINMSLGGDTPTQIMEDAIDYAIEQGVIVVASAGNSGEDGMGWPGAYPQVISCAAAGWTQEYGAGYYTYYWWWWDVPEKLNAVNYVYDPWTGITYHNNWHTYLVDFSSRPNKDLGQSWKDLDVAAPGCAVRGPYKPYGPTQWAFYAVWGTSQAAPHVSGIAALVAQSYPNIGQFTMEDVLKAAANGVPMAADGAYISDVFSNYAVWYYYWNDHDAGSGFLTVDEAFKSAAVYCKSNYGHIAK